jgi:hypothetical protein
MKYEIRAMAFGEILDTGFRLVRDRFTLLVGIGAVLYVPLALFQAYLQQAALASQGSAAAARWAGIIVMFLFILVASPIVSSAITFAVGETYVGRSVSFGQCLRAAFSIFMRLVGTTLIGTVGVILGFLLFIIPGIYLGLSWMLMWQICVLERRFGFGALRRSRELMRGNLLRGFGILFLGSLIVGILSGALGLVFGLIPYLGPVGAGLAQAAGLAFTSSLAVLLYFDIRCRKEAFDVVHLARLVEEAGGETAQAPATPMP